MFGIVYNIARNTFRECLREPIYLLVLITTLTLIGLYPVFTFFVFREQIKLVVDSSLASMLVFGWIIAVLSSSSAISREIKNGTALLLMSKPVKRYLFIIGKFCGIIPVLTVFGFLTSMATLISVRVAKDQFWIDNRILGIFFGAIIIAFIVAGVHNYVTHSSFPMISVLSLLVTLTLAFIIVNFIPGDGGKLVGYSWAMVPSMILVIFAIWAMGSIAIAFSTRFDLVSNLLICTAFFAIGLISDYLLGRYAENNALIAAIYACIPNWQLFWMADSIAAQKTIPMNYIFLGALYVALIISFLLFLAIGMFADREVGNNNTLR